MTGLKKTDANNQMVEKDKFHAVATASFVRAIALVGVLACAALAEAAVSSQTAAMAPTSGSFREESAESAGYCGAQPAGAARGAMARRAS